MDQQTAIKLLYDFLHDKIKATGTAGFEGLVSVLLQQATGQEFRLSSSGRQSGRDSASESGYANVIKLESKHYRESTSLDLRELIAEIHEAVESDPNLDIWILASSRSVSDQIASSLDKVAETHGIDVVLLDLGINGLPRLAVLMAAFSSIVIAWANRNISNCDLGAIQLALIAITAASDFESAKSALIRKLNSMIGYDSARRRIHNSLRNTLSDDNNAKSTFCQSLSIRSPSAQVVRRSGLNRQFDQWWDVSGFPLPCVALGEEGTGKTWAVFDWVMGRIDADEMPIVLPFAAVAQDLSGPHLVETLLPRLFAKWTAVLDERQWKRRLDRWLLLTPV